MKDILAMIVAVQILADDLHYRSSGEAFYANHLLADKVKDGLDKTIDELREAYWLGELKALPPTTSETYAKAIELVTGIVGASDNKMLKTNLQNMADMLSHTIEEIKKSEYLMSGTVAILDGLSSHMLTMVGLLERI